MDNAIVDNPPAPHGRPALLVAAWFCLTALCVAVDSTVASAAQGDFAQHWIRPSLTFFRNFGQYSIHVFILPIVLSSPNRRRLAGGYAAAMVGSTLICALLKTGVGRLRPGAELGAFAFSPLSFANHVGSFPSGEATSAMTLATLLGLHFPTTCWAFWGIGALASLSRVAAGAHFLSDAVFGAGLGIACVHVARRVLGYAWFERNADSSRPVKFPRSG